MPCYEVRTVSVQFKVENIDLLKKAIGWEGYRLGYEDERFLSFDTKTGAYRPTCSFQIDLKTSQIGSSDVAERELASFANSLKRAYSAAVIDEVAKKAKWMKRDLGQNRFQLQRF